MTHRAQFVQDSINALLESAIVQIRLKLEAKGEELALSFYPNFESENKQELHVKGIVLDSDVIAQSKKQQFELASGQTTVLAVYLDGGEPHILACSTMDSDEKHFGSYRLDTRQGLSHLDFIKLLDITEQLS